MMAKNDPLGLACLDFLRKDFVNNIVVHCDICDEDDLPVSYLFRKYSEMPDLEQIALGCCGENVLEIGAGAGSHALVLQQKGIAVTALDISEGAARCMESRGVRKIVNTSFWEFDSVGNFDTLLLLMNGIGIVGKLNKLDDFFSRCKRLLDIGGVIITDSSDIRYLYDNDLPEDYFGELAYKMQYKDHQTNWFEWLYVDYTTLSAYALRNNFNTELLFEGDHFDYLVRLTRMA